MKAIPWILLLIGAVACAPDIGQDPVPKEGAKVTTEIDGVAFVTTVNATSETTWVYADSLAGVDAEIGGDPRTSSEWHLGFQRFNIRTNSGTSGPANVGALRLEAAYDSVQTLPTDPYYTDTEDETAFEQGEGWFDYDSDTHELTPWPDVTWVVRIAPDSHVKLEFLSYYDENGTAAMLSFRWEVL